MMKILFVMQLPPPLHGVSAFNEMVREMVVDNTDYQYKIIANNYNKSISELEGFNWRKILILLKKYFELIYLIFIFRPNKAYFVISPHGAAFYRDLIFITTLKLARVKLVYHLHGKGIAEKSVFLQKIFRFCFKNADLICLSPLLAKDVENVAQCASISIVMNGVHAELVDLERLQLEKSSIVDGTRPVRIAMLSNLQWFKGVDYFLHLAKALLQTRTDVEFHLAGPFTATFTGDDYADFQRDLGDLAERFIYHGALYNSEKDRFMSAMDILVHPTRNDALPLVIIEALAAGLMVVATPQGGIPDLLADLVGSEVVVPEKITQAVENLLEQKDQFATFAAASRARYLARHTQQAFMANLQKVLVK
jgi:glycosyltransferase involved in cell wall biosynthesis